jgi:hypothetical protein
MISLALFLVCLSSLQEGIGHTLAPWGHYKPKRIFCITEPSPTPISFGFLYFTIEDAQALGLVWDQNTHERKIEFLKWKNQFYNKKIGYTINKNHLVSYEFNNAQDASIQVMVDKEIFFWTAFLHSEKNEGWFSYIEMSDLNETNNNKFKALVLYVSLEDLRQQNNDTRYLKVAKFDREDSEVHIEVIGEEGHVEGNIVIEPLAKRCSMNDILSFAHLEDSEKNINYAVDKILGDILSDKIVFLENEEDLKQKKGSLFFFEVIVKNNCTFQAQFYKNKQEETMKFSTAGQIFKEKKALFESEVIAKFLGRVNQSDITPVLKDFAVSSVSNALGSIYYTYGELKKTPNPHSLTQKEEEIEMITLISSRSKLQSNIAGLDGFLLMILNKWNSTLSSIIMEGLINTASCLGWMPNMQIRSWEQEAYSNDYHNVIQDEKEVSPPTLIYAVNNLIGKLLANNQTESE